MLRLCTSGTTQRIWATTLVQAATLGEGVRDFLCDAFSHVARQDRPPLATPDSESLPHRGDRIWVPPIDWGRHLVGQPMPVKRKHPFQDLRVLFRPVLRIFKPLILNLLQSHFENLETTPFL